MLSRQKKYKMYKESKLPFKLQFGLVKSKEVHEENPYYLGVKYRLVAEIFQSTKKVRQLRFGLIVYQFLITWES